MYEFGYKIMIEEPYTVYPFPCTTKHTIEISPKASPEVESSLVLYVAYPFLSITKYHSHTEQGMVYSIGLGLLPPVAMPAIKDRQTHCC